MEQRSPEWYAARLGKLTGSRIADATTRTKTGASRANYMAELLIERLTGAPAPRFTNAAMEWGTQCEPEARMVYEFEQNVSVEEVGFIEHRHLVMAGCSPDGLVGNDGLVEIKCPSTATHVDTLLGAPIDERYVKQMQFQMGCTGRLWCDWVSYDPRVPLKLRMVIRRLPRDDKMIAKLDQEGEEFLEELAEKYRRLSLMVEGKDDTTLHQLQASVKAVQGNIHNAQ